MNRLRSVLIAALLAAVASPALAQSPSAGAYHLELLSASQRADLLRRVDSYAVVEVFLRSCGRPPALESRLRRIVTGCIRQDSVDTLASHFRRALAARAALRWDCRSANGRRMIARSEHAIRLTVTDLTRLCRRG